MGITKVKTQWWRVFDADIILSSILKSQKIKPLVSKKWIDEIEKNTKRRENFSTKNSKCNKKPSSQIRMKHEMLNSKPRTHFNTLNTIFYSSLKLSKLLIAFLKNTYTICELYWNDVIKGQFLYFVVSMTFKLSPYGREIYHVR